MSDGKQQAMDPTFTIIGYYDRKQSVTPDGHFRTIDPGNTRVEVING